MRLVTSGFAEVKLLPKTNESDQVNVHFILRDFGGDALNQSLWVDAIGESMCILFVVSLADYAKREGIVQS